MSARAKPTFKACDLKRAVEAIKRCGLTITAARITKDGDIEVLTGQTAGAPIDDPLTAWERKRGKAA